MSPAPIKSSRSSGPTISCSAFVSTPAAGGPLGGAATGGAAFAETIKQHGGQILSKPEANALKFRAPDGTVAEIVTPGSFEKAKARHA